MSFSSGEPGSGRFTIPVLEENLHGSMELGFLWARCPSCHPVSCIKEVKTKQRSIVVASLGILTKSLKIGLVHTRMGDQKVRPLPSVGRDMSTSQMAVKLCGREVKAGKAYSIYR